MALLLKIQELTLRKNDSLEGVNASYQKMKIFKQLIIFLSQTKRATQLLSGIKYIHWIKIYHQLLERDNKMQGSMIIYLRAKLQQALENKKLFTGTCEMVLKIRPQQQYIKLFQEWIQWLKGIIENMHQQYLLPFVKLDLKQKQVSSLVGLEKIQSYQFEEARYHVLQILKEQPFELLQMEDDIKGVTLEGMFTAINLKNIQHIALYKSSVIFTMLHELAHLKRRIYMGNFTKKKTPQFFKTNCGTDKAEAGYYWSTFSFRVGRQLFQQIAHNDSELAYQAVEPKNWKNLNLFKNVYYLAAKYLSLVTDEKNQSSNEILKKEKFVGRDNQDWCVQVPSRQEEARQVAEYQAYCLWKLEQEEELK